MVFFDEIQQKQGGIDEKNNQKNTQKDFNLGKKSFCVKCN